MVEPSAFFLRSGSIGDVEIEIEVP